MDFIAILFVLLAVASSAFFAIFIFGFLEQRRLNDEMEKIIRDGD